MLSWLSQSLLLHFFLQFYVFLSFYSFTRIQKLALLYIALFYQSFVYKKEILKGIIQAENKWQQRIIEIHIKKPESSENGQISRKTQTTKAHLTRPINFNRPVTNKEIELVI